MTAARILAMAAARALLPTHLSSSEIRGNISAAIRLRSLFVARGTSLGFLSDLAVVLDRYLAGEVNDATARVRLLESLDRWGYSPETGFPDEGGDVPPAEPGTIRDLSSRPRMQLILNTQAQLMFGAGQKVAGEAPGAAFDFPAWELVRKERREVPRGFRQTKDGLEVVRGDSWPERWVAGGSQLVADGRMVAMKDAGIWAALGDPETFDDALGVDHPPFAFNSGMGWRPLSRRELAELGFVETDFPAQKFPAPKVGTDVPVGLSKVPDDLLQELSKQGQIEITERRGKRLARWAEIRAQYKEAA